MVYHRLTAGYVLYWAQAIVAAEQPRDRLRYQLTESCNVDDHRRRPAKTRVAPHGWAGPNSVLKEYNHALWRFQLAVYPADSAGHQ